VLALGPHPDDVEIATAGTLLLLRSRPDHRLAVVDCTRGEKGSRGTVAEREAEASWPPANDWASPRASTSGLPDTGVRVDDHATDALVAALRTVRPQLLLAPHELDVHPDHTAVAAARRPRDVPRRPAQLRTAARRAAPAARAAAVSGQPPGPADAGRRHHRRGRPRRPRWCAATVRSSTRPTAAT
jgi:LmbE family N-acetylglucosaminyl deacetylase